ncbi:MAG: DNRLRE domain-containing protein, partial [Verrucomicrobiales bacterium]
DVRLHRLFADWGEGTSNASGEEGRGATARNGDVTWLHQFFSNDRWQTEGGDFSPTMSATASVNRNGNYEWAASGMVADVQSWIDSPDTNFGWILVTRETGTESAKRFDSREATNAERRPKLSITYLPGIQEVSNRDQWISEFYEPDEVVDLAADIDGDTLSAAFEYGFGFDPKTPNAPDAGFTVAVDAASNGIDVAFRRDPRAKDLTYRVETSSDLSKWDPLVESAEGNPATGAGFISESVIGAGPFQLVAAKATAASGAFYVRLVLVIEED